MTEPHVLFDPNDPIGASADLVDNGKPLFFELPDGQKAFVIRWQGELHGWINECQPNTGKCVGGPCRGANLDAVPVTERDGQIWWQAGE